MTTLKYPSVIPLQRYKEKMKQPNCLNIINKKCVPSSRTRHIKWQFATDVQCWRGQICTAEATKTWRLIYHKFHLSTSRVNPCSPLVLSKCKLVRADLHCRSCIKQRLIYHKFQLSTSWLLTFSFGTHQIKIQASGTFKPLLILFT